MNTIKGKFRLPLTRRKSRFLFILMLVGLAFAGCTGAPPALGWSGASVSGNNVFVGSASGALQAIDISSGNKLWSVQLSAPAKAPAFGCGAPASQSGSIYSTPVVEGDRIYVTSNPGVVNAVSVSTKAVIWKYPRSGTLGELVGSPTLAGGVLFVASADRHLYALDAVTGELKWKFAAGEKLWATPAVSGNVVFIASLEGGVYAVDLNGKKLWAARVGGAVVAEPLVVDGTVYVGSFDRKLHALNTSDGSERWQFTALNTFWAEPVAYNGVLYAPSIDGKLYAIKADNGEKLREFDAGKPISASPVLVDGSVLFAAEDGAVYTVDTQTLGWRKLIQTSAEIRAPLTVSNGIIYIHAQDKSLQAIDARTGNRIWGSQIG